MIEFQVPVKILDFLEASQSTMALRFGYVRMFVRVFVLCMYLSIHLSNYACMYIYIYEVS